jgi:hypothetical protein
VIGDGPPTAILLGCVKSKVDRPAAAKDLYCSPLWARRRAYAEASGLPWMILSAEHGLVRPDRGLQPYNLALGQLDARERREWGEQVVQALRKRFGSLCDKLFEVHAGAPYRDAIGGPLARAGASIINPTEGLGIGRQLGWYAARRVPERRRTATVAEVARALKGLEGGSALIRAADWPGAARGLDHAGLYAWWVDAMGAEHLTRGLGQQVRAGRIYAGLTGATKWPSGKTGNATLGARIGRNHLRGNVGSSTFRLTLAAALFRPLALAVSEPKKLGRASEQLLSEWMHKHLTVALHPFAERNALGDLEVRVLSRLDPPLNLEGMGPSALRSALEAARRSIALGRRAS